MNNAEPSLGQVQILIDLNSGDFTVNVTSEDVKNTITPQELTAVVGGSLSWTRFLGELVQKRLAEAENKIVIAHAFPKGIKPLNN